MKKPSFAQPKQLNVFKMSCEELDQANKNIKTELKKITLQKNTFGSKRISQSPKSTRTNMINHPPRHPPPPDSQKGFDSMIIKDSQESMESKQSNYKERQMTHCNDHNHNDFNNAVKTAKRDNSFDYKIVKKDKVLVPMISTEQVKHMRLCEKMLLPNEKNYFVSEKNFKLIAEAINQKEINIQSLKILLDLAKADLKTSNTKFTTLIEDNDNFMKKIEELTTENNRLRISHADMAMQFNKMLKVHEKIIALLRFIRDNYGIKSSIILGSRGSGVNGNYDSSGIAKKINDKMKELDLIDILEYDPNDYNNDNDHNEAHEVGNMINKKREGRVHDQNEDLCKQYLKKLIDAEKSLNDLNKIKDGKFDNLSDISKDMLEAKFRIKELNDLNEKLEQENAFLRISCQNALIDNPPKKDLTLLSQIKALTSKCDNQAEEILTLKSEKANLQLEAQQIKSEFLQQQDDYFHTKNELGQYNNKMDLLREKIKEKDDIIAELKSRIIELERQKQREDSSIIKSTHSSKKIHHMLNESKDELSEYLNKSTDDCLKDLRLKDNQPKKNSRNMEKYNTVVNNSNPITNSNSKKSKMNNEKKDMDIKLLKDKLSSLDNENKNLYFEGDNEEIGVNGVTYIGDLFMHLYNQARLIERLVEE